MKPLIAGTLCSSTHVFSSTSCSRHVASIKVTGSSIGSEVQYVYKCFAGLRS